MWLILRKGLIFDYLSAEPLRELVIAFPFIHCLDEFVDKDFEQCLVVIVNFSSEALEFLPPHFNDLVYNNEFSHKVLDASLISSELECN